MKKLFFATISLLSFNLSIAQTHEDKASGGYFNNNDPTPTNSPTVALDTSKDNYDSQENKKTTGNNNNRTAVKRKPVKKADKSSSLPDK